MTHSATSLSTSFLHRAFSACALAAMLASPAVALADQREGLPLWFCSPGVAGSYLLNIDFSDGSFSSRGILSLMKDGNLVVNDSSQGGLTNKWDQFTSGQGAWRCAGSRSFSAVSVNFNIPGEIDPDGGLARLDYTGQVNRNGQISGTVELRLFELHQDPFNDTVTPIDVFNFTGQRITATYPQ